MKNALGINANFLSMGELLERFQRDSPLISRNVEGQHGDNLATQFPTLEAALDQGQQLGRRGGAHGHWDYCR